MNELGEEEMQNTTMDVLTFVSSVIDSLSWPVTIIILVIFLRKPLGNLLPNLRRIRYGDVELNFDSELHKLEGQAKIAGLHFRDKKQPTDSKSRNSEEVISDAIRLAADFPEPAVGVAWLAVEHELMQAVMRLAISADYPPYNSPIKNISLLHEHGYLDKDIRKVLDHMQRLRNAAVHTSHRTTRISANQAKEYVVLAEAVTDRLKDVSR